MQTYPETGPGCVHCLLNTSVHWPLNFSAFSRSYWATPFPFFLFRGGIPWVSFVLTIVVPTEVSGACLNITNQVIHIQIMFFSYISLGFSSKVSNFGLSLLLPAFFAFAWVLFFLRIFNLISSVIQGIEETDLLVFDGICLSIESWGSGWGSSKSVVDKILGN